MEGATKKMAYKVIAAGGTFDHLHEGHKVFLMWLFTQGERVILGVTSDEFAKDTKNTLVEPFAIRKQQVENFLKEKNLFDRLSLVSIDDVYGPLLKSDFEVEALGVTEDTYKGAEMVNEKRVGLGLSSLPILTMNLHKGIYGQPISSTAIRLGAINTNGEVWIKEEWKKNMYALPTSLRERLHEPFGPILSSIPQDIAPHTTITVGDVTTKLFNMHKIGQKISIFDFVVERTKLFQSTEDLEFRQKYQSVFLNNPAGHIAPEAWSAIEQAIINDVPTAIQVQGEEDLLVLVGILLAPLGYTIFYGQPHEGLVQIQVSLERKKHAFDLMNEFVRVEL